MLFACAAGIPISDSRSAGILPPPARFSDAIVSCVRSCLHSPHPEIPVNPTEDL